MRKFSLILFCCLSAFSFNFAQVRKPVSKKPVVTPTPKMQGKKYPSLLWEITGNGMKKPSYLFGTMHVSDKLAFHLGDSFYTAIKNSDVVALETNPENWQDDYSQSIFYTGSRGGDIPNFAAAAARPSDEMSITSFAINEYDGMLRASLSVEPSMINGMLYRTYGNHMADFEEDTYLDLYIFQTGKKLGKQLTGVENFQESERLVIEAYRDMLKDRNQKRRSYDYEGWFTNPKKLEDAYRRGDLDLLDSLEMLSVESEAFQEKFMYRRNEIQANSIDSIIRRSTLFVGVGAAHLPGKRGVIELLRKKGYSLRPVRMDERNSVQKETIDKTRSKAPVKTQTSDDGFFQVKIPGKKFYRFTDWSGMDVIQYADMVNGAYYMVTRIKTNMLSWGHTSDLMYKKIDSLLYENIPGKILNKKPVTRNGYKGWEIHNRTRRGDHQRYNIFITPFEVLVFKMSGTGEYLLEGKESDDFFHSISMKEYQSPDWISYQPPTGGFTVQLPHQPSLRKETNFGTNRLEYAAVDQANGNDYLIMSANFHNYAFVGEDSFDLNLMSESYAYSAFIDKEISRGFRKTNGYPSLDCKYKHKDGSYSTTRFIIRGAVYYVAVAHHRQENNPGANRFLESFSISPFVYPEVKLRTDSLLRYTVQSPIPLENQEESERSLRVLELVKLYGNDIDDEDNEPGPGFGFNINEKGARMVGSDTTGEKIFVSYDAPGEYSFYKDSSDLLATWEKRDLAGTNVRHGLSSQSDTNLIVRYNKRYDLPGGGWSVERHLSDTGSSRVILRKMMYRDGHIFELQTLTDTLAPLSSFLSGFFGTITPVDTLKRSSLFTRKTEKLFNDFFSTDSLVAKKARRNIYAAKFDSADVPLIKNAIERLGWSHKDYLQVKKSLIYDLSELKDSTITPFLRQLYWKVKDSADLQNSILNALINQQTADALICFRELVTQEPPIMSERAGWDYAEMPHTFTSYQMPHFSGREYIPDYRMFGSWYKLYDSLALTKKIFPEILQLINIDDYKKTVLNLLTVMVDSGHLKAADYESYFSKLYMDARQVLKKQIASEEKKEIEKASNKDRNRYYDEEISSPIENGNAELMKYAVLLLPFYDKNPGIPAFFEQLGKTRDRRLRFENFILMLRNDRKVADSLFLHFAKQDQYRIDLYRELKKMKKPDKFPAAWKTQELISRALLSDDFYSYEKVDTIVYLAKKPVVYKGKKGWVYFFKYRQMRDDVHWMLGSVGMQPENLSEVELTKQEFLGKGTRLNNDKPLDEQLEQFLKEQLTEKRPGARSFYNARAYSVYKDYLPELIKQQRYRD